jgi:RimJ/RimL family protein N-acetyltransferase
MITTSQTTTPPGTQSHGTQRRAASVNIETARLSLNVLKANDAKALIAVFASKMSACQTHAISHPFTEADAQAYIDAAQVAPYNLPVFAIRNEEGHLVGAIALSATACGKASLQQLGPNLSVFIAPEHQQMGYAPEAIEGLIKWVQKNRVHKIVQAAHFADNLPSSEVLTHGGFLYTGRKTYETSRAREGEHLVLHMIRLI